MFAKEARQKKIENIQQKSGHLFIRFLRFFMQDGASYLVFRVYHWHRQRFETGEHTRIEHTVEKQRKKNSVCPLVKYNWVVGRKMSGWVVLLSASSFHTKCICIVNTFWNGFFLIVLLKSQTRNEWNQETYTHSLTHPSKKERKNKTKAKQNKKKLHDAPKLLFITVELVIYQMVRLKASTLCAKLGEKNFAQFRIRYNVHCARRFCQRKKWQQVKNNRKNWVYLIV